MNTAKQHYIIIHYNNYLKIPNNIDKDIDFINKYISQIQNTRDLISGYIKSSSSDVVASAKKSLSSIDNYFGNLNVIKTKLIALKQKVINHIGSLNKEITFMGVVNKRINLNNITPYVESKIDEKINEIDKNIIEYKNLIDDSIRKQIVNFNKKVKSDLNQLVLLSQGKSSIISQIAKGYDEWKGYVKYGIIVGGLAVASLYLLPILNLFKRKE